MNPIDLDDTQRRIRDAVELLQSEADALRRDTSIRARDSLAAQAIDAAAAMVEDDALSLVAEVRTLRADRDRLRSAALGHVFDPENYISPLRPQIRALRDAILGEADDAEVAR